MGKAKISKQPSPYPSLPFHGLRVAQVLSSIIVTSILGFFIYHLEQETYYVPWTFILLISVSAFTLASFITTSILHHQRMLKPKYNAWVNSFLCTLWMLGFSLLTWNLSVTLTHQCSVANWSTEAGVMVCRIYKALFTFSITGMLSTLLALVLDIRAVRSTHNRGAYNPMGGDAKPLFARGPAFRDADGDAEPEPSSTLYQEPALDFGETKKPYKVQRPIEAQHFGYAAPSEQTAYDGAGDLGLAGYTRNGEGV